MTPPVSSARRNPERGTVAVLVAAFLLGLCGMAALAVDAGYWYQARRHMQAAADAAVMAGLPDLGASAAAQTTAKSRASAMASSCGYATGVTVTPSVATTPWHLTVKITKVQPAFFSRLFGFASKSMTVTSVGENAGSGPAVYAKSAVCPVPGVTVGIQLNGGATVEGDLISNGGMGLYGTFNGNGDTQYYSALCTCAYNGGPGTCPNPSTSGSSVPFPTYTTSSFGACTHGSLSTVLDTQSGALNGIYCSSGDINVSGNNITGTATFVTPGRVTISATTVTLTAAASDGVIIYSGATSNCYSNQSVNVGSSGVVLNGTIYAPNGCINTSGADVTINGSLYGNEVQLGASSGVINATGASSNNYDLYQ